MAKQKVLARDWKVEIKDPRDLQYYEILGLTSLEFGGDKNDSDTTTFDSDGYEEHIVGSRNRSLGLEAYFLEDLITKLRDPGQDACEYLSDQVGSASIGDFKLTTPSGVVKTFQGSIGVNGIGGGNDDPTGWKADITVSGKVSLAVVTATSISINPSTLSVAAGAVSAPLGSLVAFTPADTSDKSLSYAITVGNAFASVTPEGRVVGRAAGSATLTITSASGNRTCTVAITVTA